jgi:hypothetical protein
MTGAFFTMEGQPLYRPKKFGTRRSLSLQLVESCLTGTSLEDLLQQFRQAPTSFVQFVAYYLR